MSASTLWPNGPPSENASTTTDHRVAFYETDAMGIVHHANYPRFFEEARVQWLEDHDRGYEAYLDQGLHFAVTRCEVDYHQSAHFNDRLKITTALEWVRGASLRMIYGILCEDRAIATGATEHAAVDDTGRVRRIPRTDRDHLLTLAQGQRRSKRPSTN